MTASCHSCGADRVEGAKFCPECGASYRSGSDSLVGELLASRYRILEKIGEGSMGEIYLAEHSVLEKKVAVKVLHKSVELEPEAVSRFRREGVAAGKVKHASAIEVYDFETSEDGLAYLAMEYVDGVDLRQLIDEDDPLPFDEAEEIVLQTLGALQAAHDLGIVHRDLKPANIMLTTEEPRRVKVLDFGLSKLVHRKIDASLTTMPGRIIGTPLYMAPEQASGEEADHRADLYAIGLILYELLCGSRPYQGKSLTELLYAQATQPVPSIFQALPGADLPAHLDDFFVKALDTDRDERFQSADEMAEALVGRVKLPSRPVRERDRFGAPERRSRGVSPKAWVVGGLGLAVAAGLMFVLLGGGGPGRLDVARLRQQPPGALEEGEQRYLGSLDEIARVLAAGDTRLATKLADVAIADPLADAEAFLWRGRAYQADGDGELARLNFEDAIERDPGYREARVELGWSMVEAGNVEAATGIFEDLEGEDLPAADALAGLAAIARDGARIEEATSLADRAIKVSRESWRAHVVRGELRAANQAWESAIGSFKRAKNLNRRSLGALLGLAGAYAELDQIEDAQREFEAARDVAGSDGAIVRDLAALRLLNEDHEGTLLALRDLGARERRRADLAAMSAAASFGAGNPAVAIEVLRQVDGSGRSAARALALRAALQLEQGDVEAALASADRAIDEDETFHGGHYFRGVALFRLERHGDALASFERTLLRRAECAGAWLMCGVLYRDFVYVAPGRQLAPPLECFRNHLDAGGDDPRVRGWIEEMTD